MRKLLTVVLATGGFAAASIAGTTMASAAPTTSLPAATSSSADAATVITRDEAVAIALAATGGGTVTELRLKQEHGGLEYRIEIQNGRYEHELRIDAYTGEITRHRVDS